MEENTLLTETPATFTIPQYNWSCMLSFTDEYPDNQLYNLTINTIPTSALPQAPPLKKENIPVVCQSDNLTFISDILTRVTFQVFIESILNQIVASHNARSLLTTLEVDEKIIKQWDGLSLKQIAEMPYPFSHQG